MEGEAKHMGGLEGREPKLSDRGGLVYGPQVSPPHNRTECEIQRQALILLFRAKLALTPSTRDNLI